MILSTYRNPPYRNPSSKSSSPGPVSPKRKRDDESHVPLPTVQTNPSLQHTEDETSASSSPRMQVAEQLKDLKIQQIPPVSLSDRQRHSEKRKRLKRSTPLVNIASAHDHRSLETPEQSKYDLPEAAESAGEIGETPDRREQVISSPPHSPSGSPRSDSAFESPGRQIEELSDVRRSISSPPRTPTESLLLPGSEAQAVRSVSPLPFREDLTPDQAALTWQEDEITGHDIDAASGDDGEGINGVGFKPTPAMAYARRQKRRQQVNDWKAREAREARQKRFERRRGAPLETHVVSTSTGEARRIVRFAEG